MPMFDYGKNKSDTERVYAYQYMKPELQAGFYPVDNLKEIKAYDIPVMSDYGVPVYGEICYTSPLSQDQCNMYEFLEMTNQMSSDAFVPQQMSYDYEDNDVPFVENEQFVGTLNDSVDVEERKDNVSSAVKTESVVYVEEAKEGSVCLTGVKANRLFDSKNPDFKVMSMRDVRSENGYANFVVQTKNVTQNQDNTYDVVLGPAGSTQNISIVKNGKSGFVKTPVEDIKKQFEQTLVTAERKTESTKNVYLNFVDTKFVRGTKNPDFKVVSIPYSGSENGYAKVTVASANVFDSKVNGKPVVNHVNVNLGPAGGVTPVSVRKNGAFTHEMMSVEKLAELQKQAVESWKKYSSQKSTEISKSSSYQSTDVVYE